MKYPQSEEIRAMYKTGNYSLQEAKYILQQKYANEALFDAINLFNDGHPKEAFAEMFEVLSYLVNK